MLIKQGVDIQRLNREIRRALTIVDKVYSLYGYEIVVTSTFEGIHSAGSLHYSNDAFDVRSPEKGKEGIVAEMKNKLENDYDVVEECGHIHIEYDPPKKV